MPLLTLDLFSIFLLLVALIGLVLAGFRWNQAYKTDQLWMFRYHSAMGAFYFGIGLYFFFTQMS